MDSNIHRHITGDQDHVPGFGADEWSIRRANVAVGRVVGELVRTTLGPRGMDKLLIDDTGMGIVTNNGASILREMVDNPVADMITDLAVKQEDDVQDGTTTAAVLAGELLGEAEHLLDRGVHPTTIANGYLTAAERAVEGFRRRSIAIEATDAERLVQIARTAMAGKSINADANIPVLVVEAVQSVADGEGSVEDDVAVEKVTGGRVTQSHLTSGVVLGKERADASVPYRVEDANVAVVDKSIEVRDLDGDSAVTLSAPTSVDRVFDGARSQAIALVDHLDDIGVDAVICGGNIDQIPRSLVAERGMYAARRVDDDELRLLARATGANIAAESRELTPDDLGHAEVIEETDVGGERKTIADGCAAGETATLVLYGTTIDVVDEVHRAVKDALSVVALAIREQRVIPGGGASETAAALDLREYATEYDTREQLAIEGFANALETIPRTLAENAGIDPIDGLVEVRAAQSSDTSTAGIDGETGEVVDALEAGIVEPLSVKSRSASAAAEAAVRILKIDDALPKRSEFDDEEDGGAMPGGMGGPGASASGMDAQ